MTLRWLLITFMLLVIPSISDAAQLIWQSGYMGKGDRKYGISMVDEGSTSTIDSTSTNIEIKGTASDNQWALIRFRWMDELNLSDLLGVNSDAVVDSVKIFIRFSAGLIAVPFEIGTITQDWFENTVNWDNKPTISWSGVTQTITTGGAGYYGFYISEHLTNLESQETDYGIAIRKTSSGSAFFASDDNTTAALRPYIKIWISYTTKRPFWFSQKLAASVNDTYIRRDDPTVTSGTGTELRQYNTSGASADIWTPIISFEIPLADTLSELNPINGYVFLTHYIDGQTSTDRRQGYEMRALRRDFVEADANWQYYTGTTWWGSASPDSFNSVTSKSIAWGGIADTLNTDMFKGISTATEGPYCFNISTKVDSLYTGDINGFFLKYTPYAESKISANQYTWWYTGDHATEIYRPQILITFEYEAESPADTSIRYSMGPMGMIIGKKKGIF